MNARIYVEIPTVCPECGFTLVMEGEYLVCKSESCPAQTSGAIKVWVRKIGLKGWGDSILDALCEQNIVENAADLYDLDSQVLSNLTMGGRKVGSTADTILKELHSKKDMPLSTFIGSLNIPLCSRSTMKTIVSAGYDTLDKLMGAKLADIASISGIGMTRAENLHRGLREKNDLINRLLQGGITIRRPTVGSMTGKTLCMTGVRDSLLDAAFEDAGGVVKSSVVRGLTYLVAKDPNSTSGKAQKARQLGTTILSLDDMWNLLGGRP